jgi:methylthioribulose-1-phosphate dehydratase
MVVDLDGQPVATTQKSFGGDAAALAAVQRFPEIGCVLHTHSLTQTVASRLYAGMVTSTWKATNS